MTVHIKERSRKLNRVRLNVYLDLILALSFVVEMELRFTGLRNHELIGLAFGVFILLHIILHWQWIVGVTRTFFRKLIHESRLNYILNAALFIDAAMMVVTGVLISRTLGLNLGLERESSFVWERLHILSAELSLVIVALHVGLHWKWIATHAGQYLVRLPIPSRNAQPKTRQDVQAMEVQS